ncbi:HEXXH motif domain-containing protein [Streptomyces sp. NPDC059003]|uniref:HEXXH motif domain-containing protein n=1 Tax=Streptomyces sp. NPDC059003 TaxID=3346691 RepID=UPI003674ABB7
MLADASSGDVGPAHRHRLSAAEFDTLAGGGGDADLLARLWQAERSQRLLLLDLFLDLIGGRPEALGPLPAAEEAWRLLLRAESRDRAVAEDLLLRPETGLWLAAVLRRLRGGTPGAASPAAPDDTAPALDVPLWIDIGQFHALAAAAAVRAGLDFTAAVPARYGTVGLPSVGRAVLPGECGRAREHAWECAEVSYGKGELSVRLGGRVVRAAWPGGGPAIGWEPARTATLPLPGADVTVLLDDLGSERIVPPPTGLPPERLPDGEARRWAGLLREAGPLLAAADAQSAGDIAALLRSVEPLPIPEHERLRSATSGDGVGRLASGLPEDALQLAAVLAHEIQHSKLAVLMHLYRLYEPDDGSLFYAPWRDDPRSVRGLLHGVYAFTGVARFWRGWAGRPGADEESAAAAHFEYALWRRQLLRATREVQHHPGLTPLGSRVVRRLRETITGWGPPDLAPPVRAMAEDAADHHAMTWRMHHLAPDPTVVHTLARAWPRPLTPLDVGAPQVSPDPAVPHLDTVAALCRLRLTDPGALNKVAGSPPDVTALVTGASGAELLHVLGDSEAALRLSTTAVLETDADPSSWACLALALRGHVLQEAPELARAVYGHVKDRVGSAPDPVSFTAWLDGVVRMP